MTNFEFYKDDIAQMAIEDDSPAVVKGKLKKCNETDCVSCDFYGFGCEQKQKLKLWAKEECESSQIEETKYISVELPEPCHYDVLIAEMLLHCRDVLTSKHEEYATEDNFHNFNKAAAMLGETPAQALMGMRYKHEVSVCDFVTDQANGIEHSLDEWKEKIGDNINYLLILWAMINMQGAPLGYEVEDERSFV